jgi:hypothetical protein
MRISALLEKIKRIAEKFLNSPTQKADLFNLYVLYATNLVEKDYSLHPRIDLSKDTSFSIEMFQKMKCVHICLQRICLSWRDKFDFISLSMSILIK